MYSMKHLPSRPGSPAAVDGLPEERDQPVRVMIERMARSGEWRLS